MGFELVILGVVALVLIVACSWHQAKEQTRANTSINEARAVLDRQLNRKRYVCGFAFHSPGHERPRVVLIRKVKPEWQAGRLNGVGGKMELGESPQEAMAREFFEEAGVQIPAEDWQVFSVMRFPDAEVFFLRTEHAACENAKTQTVWSSELKQHITEKIEHRLVRGIDEIADHHIMPNCRWAIPMAFHSEAERAIVVVNYQKHN